MILDKLGTDRLEELRAVAATLDPEHRELVTLLLANLDAARSERDAAKNERDTARSELNTLRGLMAAARRGRGLF